MPYIYFTNPVIITTSPKVIPPARFTMKSLFSDNSLVYYKPHSLAPGGIGTVRNSSSKAKKT